jgi:hypothetical protein
MKLHNYTNTDMNGMAMHSIVQGTLDFTISLHFNMEFAVILYIADIDIVYVNNCKAISITGCGGL